MEVQSRASDLVLAFYPYPFCSPFLCGEGGLVAVENGMDLGEMLFKVI